MIRCQQCGAYHDVFAIQPRFGFPDAYLAVPENERERRTKSGRDWCVIRHGTSAGDRYFLRATLPFAVHGEPRPYSWGIWVEIDRLAMTGRLSFGMLIRKLPNLRFPPSWLTTCPAIRKLWTYRVRYTSRQLESLQNFFSKDL